MELRDFLALLRKYVLSIIAVTLLGVAVAGIASIFAKPIYTASTSMFFTVQGSRSPSELLQSSTYAESQVASYAQIVTSTTVLQPVIDRLGLDLTPAELGTSVTVENPSGTAIIEIIVENGDPALAASLATEIGAQMVTVVEELSPVDDTDAKAVVASIVTPPIVPVSPTSPRALLNLAVGLLAGLTLGIVQAVLRSTLDLSVRTDEDVARATDYPVIAKVPYVDGAASNSLVVNADPRSPLAEAYRRLCTNLRFFDIGGRTNVFVVTSSVEGEGKSMSAINIALTLAQAGDSVLLIDADLRRPRVANYLQLESAVGLTTVLIGRATVDEVVQSFGTAKLDVLTSGEIPPNPAELLGSEMMREVLKGAALHYDVVVLDAPPLLPVIDAAPLASLTRGALLVAGSGDVTIPQLRDAVTALDRVNAQLLGVVLNRVNLRHAGVNGAYFSSYQTDAEPNQMLDSSRFIVPARPSTPKRSVAKDNALARR